MIEKHKIAGEVHLVQFTHGHAYLHVQGEAAEVVDLFVEEEFRGQGLGKRYLQELVGVVSKMRGIRVIVAHVDPTNTPSMHAFVGSGFEVKTTECHLEYQFAGCRT